MTEQNHWQTLKPIPVPKEFVAAIGGHPLVAQTLYLRGVRSLEAAQAFMDPDAFLVTRPNELPDSEVAWKLLKHALQHQHQILIWGDFDVDGQTSTTTLVEGLRALGGCVSYHIPVRGKESHGISREVLTGYLHQGFDLLLTCDTGISEHEQVQQVRDAGIPVIITDHHTLGDALPPANAVVNPQRLPADHPLHTLPGVGVAYKLIEGLFDKLGKPFDAGHYQELTALGIVADVAELQADTRFLLQKGLINLRITQRTGLQTLYSHASLNPQHLNEDHIGFQIAPRLNAVGRLGDANPMVEFLTTRDTGRARVLATQIEAMNAKRRFATRQVDKAAESQLQASPDDRHAPAIVLHHPNWPGGVVGIVASRLVDRYQKPTILLTGEDPIHGSARSVEGINITEAIAEQADLLTAFGGHPMAAGLSLPSSELAAFKRGFYAAIAKRTKTITVIPKITISQTLTLDEVSLDLIEQIDRLAPFGPGNPRLHFLFENLTLVSATEVGQQGEHRQVIAEDNSGNQQRFIWWNGGDEPLPEAQFDLVCSLSKSDYKGAPQVSAEWIDFRLSEQGMQEIARRHFEIVDYRNSPQPLRMFQDFLDKNPASSVWAEGVLPESIAGLGRYQLGQVENLVIWTIPPSQTLVNDIIRKTRPQRIVVFGIDPKPDHYKGLIERLAGLIKYAVLQKEGMTTLDHLASACAVGAETIRMGLLLWQAKGEIKVEFSENSILLDTEKSLPDPFNIDTYQSILQDQFKEYLAYRNYFKTGDLHTFLSATSKIQKSIK